MLHITIGDFADFEKPQPGKVHVDLLPSDEHDQGSEDDDELDGSIDKAFAGGGPPIFVLLFFAEEQQALPDNTFQGCRIPGTFPIAYCVTA